MTDFEEFSFVNDFLSRELEKRGAPAARLVRDPSLTRESFRIELSPEPTLYASGRRGMLYAAGRLLQSLEGGKFADPGRGVFSPQKRIRGGDLSYTPTPHAPEAWSYAQAERYITEYALFGCNTIRLSFQRSDEHRSPLMKYRPIDWLRRMSAFCERLDLDVCIHIANPDSMEGITVEDYVAEREAVVSRLPRVNYIMIPGGDPGKLPPDQVFALLAPFDRMLKKYHPAAGIWVSAQMPHDTPDWPAGFKAGLARHPEGLAGVIHGPNQAMSLSQLHDAACGYDIFLYPDLTHDIRCQNFMDGVDFAMASTMSRESPNPRLREFARLYAATSPFTVGSVPYSEGINDDANKALWLMLDWDGAVTPEEAARRYARVHLSGDPERAAAGLLALEENRVAPTSSNPSIHSTSLLFRSLRGGGWRLKMFKMRAAFDEYIRLRAARREADYARALALLEKGNLAGARSALFDDIPMAEYRLRREIRSLGAALYREIGYQLNTLNFGARNPERGAILDTMDYPVSACEWLEKQLARLSDLPLAARPAAITELLEREHPREGDINRSLYGDPGAFTMFLPMIYKQYYGDSTSFIPLHPLTSRGTRSYRVDVSFSGVDPSKAYRLRTTFESASAADPAVFVCGERVSESAGQPVPEPLDFPPFCVREIILPSGSLPADAVISYRSDKNIRIAEVRLRPVSE